MHDSLFHGKPFRAFHVIDDFYREYGVVMRGSVSLVGVEVFLLLRFTSHKPEKYWPLRSLLLAPY